MPPKPKKSQKVIENIDIDIFLRDYWQKKPLLIKGGLPNWENPLSPDELAGLACIPEDEAIIDSRLITCTTIKTNKKNKQQDWQLLQGPFNEATFSELEGSQSTLLVQGVDALLPDIAALREYFAFLPSWRMDDIMVSYATQGGGVGPHFDRYDVFLIQGAGSREWKIGQHCSVNSPLQHNQPINLLTQFECEASYTLNAGDILYVPPLIAHWGSALDNDCMTYSIGFRAPSHAELFESFGHNIEEDFRYKDTGEALKSGNGEISSNSLKAAQQQMQYYLHDNNMFDRWFGKLVTESSSTLTANDYVDVDNDIDINDDENYRNIENLHIDINSASVIFRNPAIRVAYIEKDTSNTFYLFVNGHEFMINPKLHAVAKDICNHLTLSPKNLDNWFDFMISSKNKSDEQAAILYLFNCGALYT